MTGDDEQTVRALRTAMAVDVRGHHLDPGIAAEVLDRMATDAGPAPRIAGRYLAIAACLAGVIAIASGYALTRPAAKPARSAAPGAGANCAGAVVNSVLPVWARAGFSSPAPVSPHVTGARGEIIGVLFTDPLRSPPAKDHANKILWVAKDSGTGPLTIRATLHGSGRTVTRTVAGGPGPSTLDLPAAGCWQLTLTWSGREDSVELPFAS